MSLPETVVLVSVALIVGAALLPISRKLGVPHCVLLVLIGFIGSELVIALGIDTGLRWHHFSGIVFYLLIPLLIFEAAHRVDVKALRGLFSLILLLAIPASILSAVGAGVLFFWMIDHPVGFPLLVALLTGAIVSPTDPTAVVGLLKQLPGAQRVAMILEGESLFNDATAIVMYSLLLGLALMQQSVPSAGQIAGMLFFVLTGGLGLGLAVGIAVRWLNGYVNNVDAEALISVAVAYTVFIICEYWFGLSGVVAVLACGLVVADKSRTGRTVAAPSWRILSLAAEISVFLIAGATITWILLRDQWLAMLIGIVGALCARTIAVFITVSFWNYVKRTEQPFVLSEQMLIAAGGARGVVTLALALSLPLELEAWFTVQAIAYGVALFTLFVQIPIVSVLLQHSSRWRATRIG